MTKKPRTGPGLKREPACATITASRTSVTLFADLYPSILLDSGDTSSANRTVTVPFAGPPSALGSGPVPHLPYPITRVLTNPSVSQSKLSYHPPSSPPSSTSPHTPLPWTTTPSPPSSEPVRRLHSRAYLTGGIPRHPSSSTPDPHLGHTGDNCGSAR